MFLALALRQARRDRQLVSKRLLNEDEEHPEVTMETMGEQVSGHYSDGSFLYVESN